MKNYEVEVVIEKDDGRKQIKKWAAPFSKAYDTVKSYAKNQEYDLHITADSIHLRIHKATGDMKNYEVEIVIDSAANEKGDDYKQTKKQADTFTKAYEMVKPYADNCEYDCRVTTSDGHTLYEKLACDEYFTPYQSRSDYNEIISIAEKRMKEGQTHLCKF